MMEVTRATPGPVDGMTRIITLVIPSLSEGSAKVVRLGLFFVCSCA